MIGKLKGIIDSYGEDFIILDVGGVGYLVHCPSSTLARLSVGSTASLAIETKVSDDAIRLYGFLTPDEREWFRLLQTVQGVGARVPARWAWAMAQASASAASAAWNRAVGSKRLTMACTCALSAWPTPTTDFLM